MTNEGHQLIKYFIILIILLLVKDWVGFEEVVLVLLAYLMAKVGGI